MGTVIGVPLYRYLYHYTWLDWSLFGLLYVVSGLGITVGYHRLMAHRSFDCPNWVKGVLLIGGAWALQNSAIKIIHPTDYRNGPRWYHFDPSKWLIHGLYSLGLATSLRTGSYIENSLVRTN
jgi:fatty-acid desaturase